MKDNHILEGIHYTTGRLVRLEITGERISRVIDQGNIPGSSVKEGLPVIAPGLIDIQINGFMGVDFNKAGLKPDEIRSVARELIARGVTNFFITLITGSPDRISSAIKTILELKKEGGLAGELISGIHLEGPFISPEDGPRGVHPVTYCLEPDIPLLQRWNREAEGLIKILTMAPELPGSEELIRECRRQGIVVAIGHSAANKEEIRAAVNAGANLSTHLGNGSHLVLPRHPNYIWEQLADDHLYASMICDGFHLPDSVLKVFTRMKGERSILISDAMDLAGMEPGIYDSESTGRVHLSPEGKLYQERNPDILAGSASTLIGGVERMSRISGFAEAWDMASIHPAQLLNPDVPYGIQESAPADLVLLHPELKKLKLMAVYKGGNLQDF